MKNRKEMSVMKQSVLKNFIDGAAWCLYGGFALFDNIPCRIISIIFLVVAIASCGLALFAKQEEDDEMSTLHMRHAKSTSYSIMIAAVAIIGIISIVKNDMVFNYRHIYPFVLGVAEIIVGICFAVYEKVGD